MAGNTWNGGAAAGSEEVLREASYQRRRSDNVVQCSLCPHNCVIRPDSWGMCGVRRNDNGTLVLPFYGQASALAMDPIEKKPLYHFHPGSHILSIGFLGCSLRCPFCQNYRISQSTRAHSEYVSPEELTRSAGEHESVGVAYTYNEPTIHAEYVLEAAGLVQAAGLKNVLVTAGYLNEDSAKDIFAAMDAANIDLKGFQEEFYRKELKAGLKEVLRAIEIAYERCHVEITTLVIPGKNDSDEEIRSIAKHLAGIDPEIPFHLSAYYPSYRYVQEGTTPEHLYSRMEIAKQYLHHVYPGNVPGAADTRCARCGATLVTRNRYVIRT
ncbi:MAG: AmmeMemoRadiSam system radical SAM enzyme, partial [Spirochaetaceae bacterium]